MFPASTDDFSVVESGGDSEDGVDGNCVIINFLTERRNGPSGAPPESSRVRVRRIGCRVDITDENHV